MPLARHLTASGYSGKKAAKHKYDYYIFIPTNTCEMWWLILVEHQTADAHPPERGQAGKRCSSVLPRNVNCVAKSETPLYGCS